MRSERVEPRINPRFLASATDSSDGKIGESLLVGKKIKSSILDLFGYTIRRLW